MLREWGKRLHPIPRSLTGALESGRDDGASQPVQLPVIQRGHRREDRRGSEALSAKGVRLEIFVLV